MFDKIKATADYIRERCGEAEVGLILGTGLADVIKLEDEVSVDYKDIPDFPVSHCAGHKNKMVFGTLGGKRVMVMRGRYHYYEGYSPAELALPVRVMKLLGVKTLIVTNAAGGINTDYSAGDIMLISDHINWSWKNPLIGMNIDELGPRFPDMSNAYDKDLRKLMRECADEVGVNVREGVYIWFSGPSYETPAEIRASRILGADAVGMSTVPEVIAAVHCGIRASGLSCITNMAAGILDKPINNDEVMEIGMKSAENIGKIISLAIKKL